MVDLSGKIVLVTGAAGAIGSAVVQAIKQASGTAIGSDLPGKPGIDTILDVALESDWQRTNADIEQKYGRLDGLVNAAGIVAVGSIEMTEFSAWRRVIDVNLNGTFLGCKYAFPLLRKKGGAIVNLSSVLGMVGGPNLVAYSASKGGVSLLTKSVALHGARYQPPVRCNAVCPAFIEGQMVDEVVRGSRDAKLVTQKLTAEIPLARMGHPEEVAALCVYLLSDEAAFMTGTLVPIDGGLTAR
jgi:NAD(P)-dependent dehydrogenase (short-subunit alcohol dehydrogenase family)